MNAGERAPDPRIEQSPQSPRVWSAWLALPAALVALLAGQLLFGTLALVYLVVQGMEGEEETTTGFTHLLESPPGFLGLILFSQLSLLALVGIAAALSPVPWRERLGLVRSRLAPWQVLVVMLGSVFVTQLCELWWHLWFDEPSAHLLAITETVQGASPPWAIALILALGLFPGFCEEVAFRGYIQGRFLQRYPAPVAIGLASTGFAAMHFDPQHILAVLPLAFWMGYVGWRSGSVWTTAWCHFFVNSTSLTITRLSTEPVTSMKTIWVFGGLTLPFFLASLVLLERARRRSPREPAESAS